MAVVKRMKIGNTRITICDDCAVKTAEEKKAILNRISDMLLPYVQKGIPIRDEPLQFEDKVIYCDENWQPIEKGSAAV